MFGMEIPDNIKDSVDDMGCFWRFFGDGNTSEQQHDNHDNHYNRVHICDRFCWHGPWQWQNIQNDMRYVMCLSTIVYFYGSSKK